MVCEASASADKQDGTTACESSSSVKPRETMTCVPGRDVKEATCEIRVDGVEALVPSITATPSGKETVLSSTDATYACNHNRKPSRNREHNHAHTLLCK